MTINTAKLFLTTKGNDVLCLQNHSIDMLSLCNHEEADSRLLLHIADAVYPGMEKVLVPITDTDVVVLAVSVVQKLGGAHFGFGLEPAIIKDLSQIMILQGVLVH